MSLLTFEHCCFCIDLRIGCLIIGYLDLIGNIALAVLASLGIHDGIMLKRLAFDDAFDLATPVIATNAAVLVFTLLFLMFSIILLVGIHKYKRVFVKAFIIYGMIFLVLLALTFFVSLGYERLSAGEILKHIITILCNIYFLLVIRSYYITMGDMQTTYN